MQFIELNAAITHDQVESSLKGANPRSGRFVLIKFS